MELIYIWIHKYKNIKEQEFNFSPNIIIHYDQNEKEFLITENDSKQPNRFFGDSIQNITAIIGKNGSGKSNLLDLIRIILSDTIKDLSIILAFTDSLGKIKLYYSSQYRDMQIVNTTSSDLEKNEFNIFNLESKLTDGALEMTKLIYLSSLIDFREYEQEFPNEINLSSENLLENDMKEMGHFTGGFKEYHRLKQVGRQVDYITSRYYKASQVNLPSNIEISFMFSSGLEFPQDPPPAKYFQNFWKEEDKKIKDEIEIQEAQDFVTSHYTLLQLENNFAYSIFKIVKSNIEGNWWTNYPKEFFEDFSKIKFLEKIEKWLKSTHLPLQRNRKEIALKLLQQGLSLISKSEFMDNISSKSFIIDPLQFKNIKDTYIEFTRHFEKAFLLNFNWVSIKERITVMGNNYTSHNLSSGEIRLLDLYSKLYNARTFIDAQIIDKKTIDYLYLLIDEGESGFHPQWQKEFISELISNITCIFKEFKIQIILTTHSPIIASDLPKSNIIFLDNIDGKMQVSNGVNSTETFGANIHSLYMDAFILQNGLMGTFAKSKINEVIKLLHNKEKVNVTDDMKYIINHIGEPVIKRKLDQIIQGIQDDKNK